MEKFDPGATFQNVLYFFAWDQNVRILADNFDLDGKKAKSINSDPWIHGPSTPCVCWLVFRNSNIRF